MTEQDYSLFQRIMADTGAEITQMIADLENQNLEKTEGIELRVEIGPELIHEMIRELEELIDDGG